jgi:MFS family permease
MKLAWHPTTLADPFRALRVRDFRLFFVGQGISLIGTWMQRIALAWLVYQLTGSALLLGAVAFAGQFPSALLAPFGGALADRWSRHRIVIATQSLAAIQALLLAALVLSGGVQVWHIIVLTVCSALIDGVDIPARQSLLVQLVKGPTELGNAIALNSSLFNGARLIGPAAAGILIAVIGEGLLFLINGLSYIAVIGALLAMRVTARPPVAQRPPVFGALREGFSYAFGFVPIRSALTLLAIVNLVGVPYLMLLPVFATDVLDGGAHTFGFLMAATGLGALVGAGYLATRSTVRGLSRLAALCAGMLGVGLVVLAQVGTVWIAFAVLLVTGFGMMVHSTAINTMLQTLVNDEMRGRVMSLYSMAILGMAPIGKLLYGGLANQIGAPTTVLVGGFGCVAAALWFARQLPVLRERIRPIYLEMGIIRGDEPAAKTPESAA